LSDGGLPFYLLDEKSEAVHLDNLRARVIESILASPYTVEYAEVVLVSCFLLLFL
jgi:hypothetical protein